MNYETRDLLTLISATAGKAAAVNANIKFANTCPAAHERSIYVLKEAEEEKKDFQQPGNQL